MACTQALDDAVGLGRGWTWQLPWLGMSLLGDDDSVPTDGWAGTGSSPLMQTPGAADRKVFCILFRRKLLLPSTELTLASLTSEKENTIHPLPLPAVLATSVSLVTLTLLKELTSSVQKLLGKNAS